MILRVSPLNMSPSLAITGKTGLQGLGTLGLCQGEWRENRVTLQSRQGSSAGSRRPLSRAWQSSRSVLRGTVEGIYFGDKLAPKFVAQRSF